MGGGGKGGGGGDSTAATALNFQIVQWLTDQENQKTAAAKQDEYNTKMLEMTSKQNAQQQSNWEKTFALQQQTLQTQQSVASSAATSTTGNVSTDNAAKSSQGQAAAGRVKTLYSLPSARTRGTRVVLGSSGDTNNNTVFKRVLGE